MPSHSDGPSRGDGHYDVVQMAYNTTIYTNGHRLAATDTLTRVHPDVLRAMRPPSRAHRI